MVVEEKEYKVTGMTCANCVATVERGLKKLAGVEVAVVNGSAAKVLDMRLGDAVEIIYV